jgi:hypothetical protein
MKSGHDNIEDMVLSSMSSGNIFPGFKSGSSNDVLSGIGDLMKAHQGSIHSCIK